MVYSYTASSFAFDNYELHRRIGIAGILQAKMSGLDISQIGEYSFGAWNEKEAHWSLCYIMRDAVVYEDSRIESPGNFVVVMTFGTN